MGYRANIYTSGRTKLDVGGAAVESRHSPPPPCSKRQRGAADVIPAALIVGGKLGVSVAPQLQTALLHIGGIILVKKNT